MTKRLLDLMQARAPDPRAQPTPDVATTGYSRKVVEGCQSLATRERLQDTERERRAANSAAGQRQPYESRLIGLGCSVRELCLTTASRIKANTLAYNNLGKA